MRDITLEELLEAGCHFGHQVTRQNPKARDFVFEARDGIHIIDLTKTKEYLDEALVFVREVATRPDSSLLVVGTKRQAQDIIAKAVNTAKEEVAGTKKDASASSAQGEKPVAANIFTVTNKWIGGTLTNLSTIQKNAQKLHDLTVLLKNEDAREKYTKRELGLFERERAKLESFYSGVADMKNLPTMIFVVDTHTEHTAVAEANRINIPVVGIVDTNADPDVITHPIPANDDAIGSIELLTNAVLDAWTEGKTGKEVKSSKLKVKSERKEETPVEKAQVSEGEESPVKTKKKKKTGAAK